MTTSLFSEADRAVLASAVTEAYKRGYYAPKDVVNLSREGIKTLAQMPAQGILDLAILSLPLGTRIAVQCGMTLDSTLKDKALEACKCIKGDAQIRRIRMTPKDVS